MAFVVLYVVLALGGLGVLACLGLRLWRDVRELSHTVAGAADRLRQAAAGLEEATRTSNAPRPGLGSENR